MTRTSLDFPPPQGTAPKATLCPGTCADDPSILVVAAVMDSPAEAVAGGEEGLAAVAVDVVQEDAPRAVAEIGVALVIQGLAAAHLLAHHAGIAQAPVIVADGAPVPAVEDLHPALAGVGPAHQTDAAVTWRVTARGEKGVAFPGRSRHAPRHSDATEPGSGSARDGKETGRETAGEGVML